MGELESQHSICVGNGMTGSVTLYASVVDGRVNSVVVNQKLVTGKRAADVRDARNVAALAALRAWFAERVVRSGKLIMQLHYTDGITSVGRINVGVVSALG